MPRNNDPSKAMYVTGCALPLAGKCSAISGGASSACLANCHDGQQHHQLPPLFLHQCFHAPKPLSLLYSILFRFHGIEKFVINLRSLDQKISFLIKQSR